MKKKLIVIASPPVIGLAIFFFRNYLTKIILCLPSCIFYETTGLYCPGCGNSRSLRALMHGNIILSLRNNIAMPLIAMLLLILYIEYILSAFGKKIHILPRKTWIWMCVISVVMIYYIIRNFVPQIAPV